MSEHLDTDERTHFSAQNCPLNRPPDLPGKMTSEEITERLENLRAIFDKNRKIETDDDLLELSALTEEDE